MEVDGDVSLLVADDPWRRVRRVRVRGVAKQCGVLGQRVPGAVATLLAQLNWLRLALAPRAGTWAATYLRFRFYLHWATRARIWNNRAKRSLFACKNPFYHTLKILGK